MKTHKQRIGHWWKQKQRGNLKRKKNTIKGHWRKVEAKTEKNPEQK